MGVKPGALRQSALPFAEPEEGYIGVFVQRELFGRRQEAEGLIEVTVEAETANGWNGIGGGVGGGAVRVEGGEGDELSGFGVGEEGEGSGWFEWVLGKRRRDERIVIGEEEEGV